MVTWHILINVPVLKSSFTKKNGKRVCNPLFLFYGCFLSSRTTAAKPTINATNRPATAGRKYWSAIEGAAVGCGVAVAGASTA
jgi:hypothetical protein